MGGVRGSEPKSESFIQTLEWNFRPSAMEQRLCGASFDPTEAFRAEAGADAVPGLDLDPERSEPLHVRPSCL